MKLNQHSKQGGQEEMLKIYEKLKQKVSDLNQELEKLRPKEKYLVWWRCYKTGEEWRYKKCFTVEEMNNVVDYLTDNGRTARYYEIFKTKIIEDL